VRLDIFLSIYLAVIPFAVFRQRNLFAHPPHSRFAPARHLFRVVLKFLLEILKKADFYH
jgi:hypothetical protein